MRETTALAAPEVSGELVEDLLEALAELEIEVADESEAPPLRGHARATQRTGALYPEGGPTSPRPARPQAETPAVMTRS